jgi:hypothetical protein
MLGSRNKISSKNLFRQRCAEGINSGVKGLMYASTRDLLVGITFSYIATPNVLL